MNNKIIKQFIIITCISLLIIPMLSIMNSIKSRSEYKAQCEFTASYLMLDLMEKTNYSINTVTSSEIKWNPKYFEKYSGEINFREGENNINTYTLKVRWPKNKNNFLEFMEFKLNLKKYTKDRLNILYEKN